MEEIKKFKVYGKVDIFVKNDLVNKYNFEYSNNNLLRCFAHLFEIRGYELDFSLIKWNNNYYFELPCDAVYGKKPSKYYKSKVKEGKKDFFIHKISFIIVKQKLISAKEYKKIKCL